MTDLTLTPAPVGSLTLTPVSTPPATLTLTQASVTLAADAAAGATTLTLPAPVPGLQGSLIAVSVGGTGCEVRVVKGVSGTTATLNSALKYAHTTGDTCLVAPGPYIPLAWYGVQFGNSAVDSFQNLKAAMIDQGMQTNGGWILTGNGGDGGSPTYSSRPLCLNDKRPFERFTINTFSTFGFDCRVPTWRSEPWQYFLTYAGQSGTATFDSTTDQVTVSGGVAGAVGDIFQFYARPGATMPGGLEEGRWYFTLAATATTQLCDTRFGSTPINITSNGSGEIVVFSPGQCRPKVFDGSLDGGNVAGLSGFYAHVQQPGYVMNLRTQNFPMVAQHHGGQEGKYWNLMATGGRRALECGAMDMGTFIGCNFENADRPIHLDYKDGDDGNLDAAGFPSSWGVTFTGGHVEAPASGSQEYQTVKGNASVSAGTFTLTFKSQTTSAIAYNAPAATIQAALEALSTIDPGDITCTDQAGGLPGGRCQVYFTSTGQYRWTNVADLTITSAGLTGGTYTINRLHPSGSSIHHEGAWGIVFDTVQFTSTAAFADGTYPPQLLVDNTNNAANEGGYELRNCIETTGALNMTAIHDLIRSKTVLWDDVGHRINYYAQATVHSANTDSQSWTIAGDSGRSVGFSSKTGKPLFNFTGSVSSSSVHDKGFIATKYSAAPADADLATGELAFWLDATPGATKLMVKAKDSGGTVRTATINLA